MLQDIAPKQYHVEFQTKKPDAEGLCFLFQERAVLERVEGEQALLPAYKELEGRIKPPRYLFRIDQREYYLVEEKAEIPLEGYVYQNLLEGRRKKSKELCFAEMTAYHLHIWYRDHQFCGRCGAATVPDDRERMLRCPACGNMIYPQIAPAVIVAVTDGDRILMTRYRGRAYTGYALIAGFTEVGETAEETVAREVMEEVGLRVKNLRYYASQPWGSASNLLMGYFARLDGPDQIHMDREELSQAAWYHRDEVEIAPDGFSLTNDMISAFCRGEWD